VVASSHQTALRALVRTTTRSATEGGGLSARRVPPPQVPSQGHRDKGSMLCVVHHSDLEHS